MTDRTAFPEPQQTIRRGLVLLAAIGCIGAALYLVINAGLPDRADTNALYRLQSGAIIAPEVGAQAPPFTLDTLDGNTLSLAALRGDVVVINFWATWCTPCRVEMPALETLAASYPSGLTVVGVNVGESAQAVHRWQNDYALTFPLVLDSTGSAARDYRLRGQPTTVIVAPDGIIHTILYGPADIGVLTRTAAALLPATP